MRVHLDKQVEVAAQERALGEDGDGGFTVGECRDDAGHEAVASLGTLVRVGVGTEGHRMPPPGGFCEFFS